MTNSSTPKRGELPTLIARVENHAIKELSKALADVFDRADDTLFEMADRAVSNSEQNLYFESMREIRIRRRGLENGFRQALENNFMALLSDAAREPDHALHSNAPKNPSKSFSSASNDEGSLDHLTLMKNDDLEEAVAIDSMVSKFKNLTSVEMGKLNCRFESLLLGTKVSEANNPLGAVKVVRSFTNMGAILDLDIKTKLILFKLFDAQVLGCGVELVMAANKIFAEAGVLPQLKSVSPRAQTSSAHSPTASSLDTLGEWESDQSVSLDLEQNPHGALGSEIKSQESQATRRHPGAATGLAPTHQSHPSVFETIQNLLSLSRDSESTDTRFKCDSSESGNAPIQTSFVPPSQSSYRGNASALGDAESLAEGTQVSRPNLMAMLSAIQCSFHQSSDQDQSNEFRLDIKHELGRILKGQEKKRGRFQIDQNDDDVINVVGMMFNVILEDRNLSDGMKAVIGRLQIPLVKVALLDQRFFSQSAHPARKLLNALAKAGVGCVDENHSGRDAIFCKIQTVVQDVLDQSGNGIELYESLLSEFELFITKEEKRSALIERRILDAETGRAKTDQARSEVNVAIQSLLAGKDIPPVVLKLVKGAWANVLFVALLKGGADSNVWHKKLATASDLIWSVQPGSSAHSKKRLLEIVPNLLVELREGLTEISFNPCEMSQLFADLQALHLHLLEGGGRADATLTDEPKYSDVELFDDRSRVDLTTFFADDKHDRAAPIGGDSLARNRVRSGAGASASPSEGPKSIADITKEILEKSLGRAEPRGESKKAVAARPRVDSATRDGDPAHRQRKSAPKPVLELSAEDLQAQSSNDEDAASEHQYLEQYRLLDALGVGSWVEFITAAGGTTRCKLAAKIAAQKKFIFVNRNGVKIIERLRYELAQSMDNGNFRVLDDSCLFDRALESVISNLRGKPSNAGSNPNPNSRAG